MWFNYGKPCVEPNENTTLVITTQEAFFLKSAFWSESFQNLILMENIDIQCRLGIQLTKHIKKRQNIEYYLKMQPS